MLTLYIALMGTVATLLILWVELATAYKSRTVPVKHTRDCDAWSPKGLTDPLCHAPHTTDHFATIREQVNLTDSLDSQIGFKP